MNDSDALSGDQDSADEDSVMVDLPLHQITQPSKSLTAWVVKLLLFVSCYLLGSLLGFIDGEGEHGRNRVAERGSTLWAAVPEEHDGLVYRIADAPEQTNSSLPTNPVADPASCEREDIFDYFHSRGGYTTAWAFSGSSR